MSCRSLAVAAAALIVASAFAAPAVAAPQAASGDRDSTALSAAYTLKAGILVEINKLRARHRLAPLRLSPRLSAAADAHSRAMLTAGVFSHTSPDGTSFWKRIQRWYGSHGYRQWSVGENLLFSSPGLDGAAALQLWLASPPHRKNMLAPEWREIGLSAVSATAAPGDFEGVDVTVLTADFGVRR